MRDLLLPFALCVMGALTVAAIDTVRFAAGLPDNCEVLRLREDYTSLRPPQPSDFRCVKYRLPPSPGGKT